MKVLSACVALFVLCVSSALGADRNRVGINVHGFEGPNGPAVASRAAESGVGWVRVDFNWYSMEPRDANGRFDWAATDQTVNNAYSNGLNILATLAYTPPWANGTEPCPNDGYSIPLDSTVHCPPDASHLPDWEDFVREAVRRYGDRIKYFSVWNEPNPGTGFFRGTPERYDQVYAAAYRGAKSAGYTDIKVVGFESTYGGSPYDAWLLARLNAAANAGAAVDVVAVHFYGTPYDAETNLRRLASLIGTGRPIWLTETGDPVDYPSFLNQEHDLAGKVGLINRGIPGLDKVFYYDINSDERGIVSLWYPFSRKPAFNALKYFMQGSYSDFTGMNKCTGVNGMQCSNACYEYEYSCSMEESTCIICP